MKHSLRRLLYTIFLLGIGIGFILFLKPDTSRTHSLKKDGLRKDHEQETEKTSKGREEYYFRMLRDPATNSIPKNIRASELAYARHLMNWQQMHVKYSSSSTASVTNAYTWSQAGPYDVGGRTRALAIDINNSSHIVAGGASGGIWESKDAGQTWSLRNTSNQNLSVTDVVQNPLNPQVWYYSSGEYNNSMSIPYKGTGIYKSTDNGDSWQVLSSTQVPSDTSYYSEFQYVSKIAISPTTGTLFLASNNFGIYRSTNGGQSFTHTLGSVNDHTYIGLAVSKNGYILAALSADGFSSSPTNPAGLYLSTDDGQTWKNITPSGFPSYFERTVMAFAPSQSNVAYTMTYDGSTSNSQSKITFYKLTIKGDTLYSADNRSANIPNYGGKVGQFNVQQNYNMVISVKPDNSNFVVIGATNLFRSKDGFSTKPTQDYGWIGGYDTANNISGYPGQHPDEHIFVFDPNSPNHAWVGSDGGVSYTSDITTTSTTGDPVNWSSENNGYMVSQFYTITMKKDSTDNTLLGGTQDNGSPFFKVSTNLSSTSLDVSSGDGIYAYLGTNYGYAGSDNGTVYRNKYDANGNITLNTSFTDVTPPNASNQLFITPYTIDPKAENIMYYLAGDSLWRNTHVTGSSPKNYWYTVSKLKAPSQYVLSSLSVSHKPIHILYVGASTTNMQSTTDLPIVYRIENSDTSSTVINRGSSQFPAGAYISDIAVNPTDANKIMVIFSNYDVPSIFYSSDGGQTYTNVEGNLSGSSFVGSGPSVRAATIIPTKNGTYYLVGTSTGLYMTDTLNGSSTTWVKQANGTIGDAIVDGLTSRTSDGRVAVASFGRGVFIGDLNNSAEALPVQKQVHLPSKFNLNQNYPNPFNPSTNISYSLPVTSKVSISIYNIMGRKVEELVTNATESSGSHLVTFYANNLASGTYFYRITAIPQSGNGARFTETKKMILLK